MNPSEYAPAQPSYRMVLAPVGHPRRKGKKITIAEHILIAEKALGHYLPEGAIVHHVDLDKTHNANTNLVICEDHRYHALLHVRSRVVRAGGDPNTQKVCMVCETLRPNTEPFCGACAEEQHQDEERKLEEYSLRLPPHERLFLIEELERYLGSNASVAERIEAMERYRAFMYGEYDRRGIRWLMSESNCLFPSCTSEPRARGLCAGHYRVARRLVIRGTVTWDQLEARHKCLPPKNTADYQEDYEWFKEASVEVES